MKALILFGSPHNSGNTKTMVDTFIKNFNGQCEIIDLYNNSIEPCIDCGNCKTNLGCVIKDEFNKLLSNQYDVLVIASPIYMSNLPAVFWSIINRTNFTFYNNTVLHQKLEIKEKIGIVLLCGGGYECKQLVERNNTYLPLKQCKYIFYKLNVQFKNKNYVYADKTNELLVKDNKEVLEKIKNIAKSLNFKT